MVKYIITGLIFLQIGCASSRIKDNCKDTNWYERGYAIAMKGQMTDADFFVKKCESVKGFVNYQDLDVGFKAAREKACDPKQAKAAGKKGEAYHFPLCSSYNERIMRSNYEKGAKSFCHPEKAYNKGLSGVMYKKSCPQNMEAAFLQGYERGRKQFVLNSTKSKKESVKKIDSKISKLESKINNIKSRLKKINKESFRYSSEEIQVKRESLSSEIQTHRWAIDSLQSEKIQIQEEIQKIK